MQAQHMHRGAPPDSSPPCEAGAVRRARRVVHTLMHTVAATLILCTLPACRSHRVSPIEQPPAMLLGEFADDYGNRFTISVREWLQLPHGRFHVIRWNARDSYLVARNDSANRSAPGRWTRIDWMPLPGMPPYEWAFCLTAYDAASARAAEATTVARRDTPRNGCNGFPFSRMARVANTAPRPPASQGTSQGMSQGTSQGTSWETSPGWSWPSR